MTTLIYEQYKTNFNRYHPEIQFMDGSHIEKVFGFLLDEDFKNKVIFAPPRSGLSTQIGCGYVQYLLTQHPNQEFAISLVYSSEGLRDMWRSKLYRAMPELKYEFSLHTVEFLTLDENINPNADIVLFDDVIFPIQCHSLEIFDRVVQKFIYGCSPRSKRVMWGLQRVWDKDTLENNVDYFVKCLDKVNIGNTQFNYLFLKDVNKGDWSSIYNSAYIERLQKYLGKTNFELLYGYAE